MSSCRNFAFFTLLSLLFVSPLFAQYQYAMEVQVVDLQVSVQDKQGSYLSDLKPEDFLVWEDGTPQQVLDLDLARQPFSIGILLDTSSSMESAWRITAKTTEDFIAALRPEDEYFLMLFDDQIKMKQEMKFAGDRVLKLEGLKYGARTRMFDAILQSIELLNRARYPRHALFVISDGVNTYGAGSEKKATDLAQKTKTIIYSLIVQTGEDEFNSLRSLSDATGGTWFRMWEQYPRMQAAYEKIAADLSHRFTLYYRSAGDYSKTRKPLIKVKMKNPDWRVQYQNTYYPGSKGEG